MGVMLNRLQGRRRGIIMETEIGNSRRWPVRKVEPGLRIGEGGGCSNQIVGNARKLVSVYETKLKFKNEKTSGRGRKLRKYAILL
jgi:hypothetical protein